MLKFEVSSTSTGERIIVLLFGAGLIGQSIRKSLHLFSGPVTEQWFRWTWPDPTSSEQVAISDAIQATCSRGPSARLVTIWAAGKSGFGTSQEGMEEEFAALSKVVELTKKVFEEFSGSTPAFVLLSSAGGLFEGQIACDHTSRPAPIRPYGAGKAVQERYIADESALGRRLIVRPSSVYGYAKGGRFGLVSALIDAGLKNRTASIFGALTTQRDYVFAPDVGHFVAEQCLFASDDNPNNAVEKVFLAAGRPASVFEVINIVEDIFGMPLLLKIDASPANARDNTFKASALPVGFSPTPLQHGIVQTINAMKANRFGT